MFEFMESNSFIKDSSIISASCKIQKSAIEVEEKILSIKNMDAYRYERIFVQVIADIATQKGIPDAQLAREAWPHQRGAATAWRKMRNDEENPKRLNIEEAVLLTQRLGVSMSDVCGMVQGRLLNLVEQPQEPSFREKAKAKTVAVQPQALEVGVQNS